MALHAHAMHHHMLLLSLFLCAGVGGSAYGNYSMLRTALATQQRRRGQPSEVELAELDDNQTGLSSSHGSLEVSMRRDLNLLNMQLASEIGQDGLSWDVETTWSLATAGRMEGDAVAESSLSNHLPLAAMMRIELPDLRFVKAQDGSLICLGTGGQGKVYAAMLHTTFPVAVKILPHNGGDLTLVLREAEVLFKCSHPNILQVGRRD